MITVTSHQHEMLVWLNLLLLTQQVTHHSDMTHLTRDQGVASSTTRAVFCGGYNEPSIVGYSDYNPMSRMQYMTFATKGIQKILVNLVFVVLNLYPFQVQLVSNNGGSNVSPYPNTNVIEFITIATLEIPQILGIYSKERWFYNGNSIRGIFAGGYNPTFQNVIEHVTIASTSNATDFGDLLTLEEWSIMGRFHGGSWINIIMSQFQINSITDKSGKVIL